MEALLTERRTAIKAKAGGWEALAQRALGVLAQVELAGIGQLGQAYTGGAKEQGHCATARAESPTAKHKKRDLKQHTWPCLFGG